MPAEYNSQGLVESESSPEAVRAYVLLYLSFHYPELDPEEKGRRADEVLLSPLFATIWSDLVKMDEELERRQQPGFKAMYEKRLE